MILTCPSCGTRYQADSSKFKPPGRNVRCANCHEVWFQASREPEVEPESKPAIAPVAPAPNLDETAVPERSEPGEASAGFATGLAAGGTGPRSEPEEAPRRSRGVAFAQSVGWAVLIFLIAGIGWATVQYRETIVSLWPQSAIFYAALGMPVNVRGVALADIAYQQAYEDGQPVLSVTGKVINIGDRELAVPEIRVVLLDDTKHELYHWTFNAGIATLKPGAQSPFMTRLSRPPPETRNLNVRFAESGEPR